MEKDIDEDEVKITFPCLYPIKVMGPDVDDYSSHVVAIIKNHAPDLTEDSITFRPSRHGKYLAVNVIIMATGIEQLQAIHKDLKDSGRVSMVL